MGSLRCEACPYTGGCTPVPGGWCEKGLLRGARTYYTPISEPVYESHPLTAARDALVAAALEWSKRRNDRALWSAGDMNKAADALEAAADAYRRAGGG